MNKLRSLPKKRIWPIVFFIAYFLSCVVSSTCFSFSRDFDLERIAYSINDYNKHIKTTDFISPTVTVKKKSQETWADKNYFDLYRTYYYGFMADHILEYSSEDYLDSFNNSLRFHTQMTFSINQQKNRDDLYALDGNLFGVYFCNEVLGEYGNLVSRNGCDTFAFVSDKYADMLLEKYNLSGYSELILDNVASILTYTGMDGNTYKASINNVVSSSFKNGVIAAQDDPYFVLIYLNANMASSIDVQFQIGLKSSPYCIKNVLETIERYGYNYDEYDIRFQTVDYRALKLLPNASIEKRFKNYLEKEYDDGICYAVASFLSILLVFSYVYLFKRMPKEMDIVLLVTTVCFCIANVIFSFLYSYYGFLLVPTIVEACTIVYRLAVFVKRRMCGIVYEVQI